MGERIFERPVLDGEPGRRARELARIIGDALCDLPDPASGDPSLADGLAGIALFLGYLSVSTSDERYADTALSFIERAIEGLPSRLEHERLFDGRAGVVWVTQHLGKMLWDTSDLTPLFQAMDDSLLSRLDASRWEGYYDLVLGLVGYGVYFLERLPEPVATAGLVRILGVLDVLAERTEHGTTFRTAFASEDSDELDAPLGLYNLGLAHGVPGVIALLAELSVLEVTATRARQLLESTVRWLLSQKLPGDAGSCFPCRTWPAVTPVASRLGWCHGDLGIATSLMLAARRAGVKAWEQEARRVARDAALRSATTAGVTEPSLCHGAAGVGHMFNRLYRATREPLFAHAARAWLQRAMDMRRAGEGVAGYLSPEPVAIGDPREPRWLPDPGFLNGAAGIGLALLSGIRPTTLDWDRILLLALPS
jgi:lantibiotic modifying enzyme